MSLGDQRDGAPSVERPRRREFLTPEEIEKVLKAAGRREALVWRCRGGRGQAPADRRSWGILLRRQELTFPFSSVGADSTAMDFSELEPRATVKPSR